MLKKLWSGLVEPILHRPTRFQVAGLCYRVEDGVLKILVITSLDTGRWVLPKGWPKEGFGAAEMAAEEAWEEAGVKPRRVHREPVGRYSYAKRLKGGVPVETDVDVYAIEVEDLATGYPEEGQRRQKWMTPDEAAEAVDEPSLKRLLRNLPAEITGLAG